jgi:hypothetical protein
MANREKPVNHQVRVEKLKVLRGHRVPSMTHASASRSPASGNFRRGATADSMRRK